MGESDNSWVLLILAVLPAAVVMYFVWKMDKREKEPVKLLMQFFGLGALSTISAIILELLFGNLLNSALGSWIPEQESILDDPMEKMEFWHKFIYQFINNFFCIALVEEAGKYVMLHVRAWKCPEFDYSYDAIVYAVATSLGFATVENILYVFNSERGVSVAVMRAILSVPGHAIFAVFMGSHYGKAKLNKYIGDNKAKRRELLLAIVIPTALHGTYDFCLSLGYDEAIAIFFLFEVIVTILAIRRIIHSSRNDMPVAEPRWNPAFGFPGYPMPGYPMPAYPMPGYPMPGYPMQQGFRPMQQPAVSTATVNAQQFQQAPATAATFSSQQFPANANGMPQPYFPRTMPQNYPVMPQPYAPQMQQPFGTGYPAQQPAQYGGYPQPVQQQPAATAYPNGYARPGMNRNTDMPELPIQSLTNPQTLSNPHPWQLFQNPVPQPMQQRIQPAQPQQVPQPRAYQPQYPQPAAPTIPQPASPIIPQATAPTTPQPAASSLPAYPAEPKLPPEPRLPDDDELSRAFPLPDKSHS
jgi:RsiW-degrading membrane proteinase PrsW (M82 family)